MATNATGDNGSDGNNVMYKISRFSQHLTPMAI